MSRLLGSATRRTATEASGSAGPAVAVGDAVLPLVRAVGQAGLWCAAPENRSELAHLLAARGGLDGARYPWGDEHPVPGRDCNVFVGAFPEPAGPVGTVPAAEYEPNGYGLYQAVGNVWEWCADRFSARYYRASPEVSPTGPDRGTARVLRGGSHLCHDSYCYRYRTAARSHNTPTSTASNIGFRTVSDSDIVNP